MLISAAHKHLHMNSKKDKWINQGKKLFDSDGIRKGMDQIIIDS